MKTLVIGGTGNVGSVVAAGLRKRGVEVRIMSRSQDKLNRLPKGMQGVMADLDEPDTLAAAFEGMDGVFLINSVGPNETNAGLNAVSAARDAKIKKLVYQSVSMPEGSDSIPHFRSKLPVEQAVRESGIAWTILRPNNFFQNDLRLEVPIARFGVYPQPLGGKGISRVDVRDIADCAINALTRSGHEGRTYEIHGPDVLTGEGVARIYAAHLGREVRYGGDDLDAWAKNVNGMMPEFMIADMRIMYAFFQDNGMIAKAEDLEKMEKLLNGKPRTFDAFVTELVKAWKAAPAKAA
jgi:uncharacterized protein YbjT (DUF2867 family)